MKQNAYICIPKTLFTDPKYNKISAEAKLLYGLLLDRIKLSKSHGWQDKDGKSFLYFTIDEAKVILSCSNEKAVKTFAELDDKKGVGLIHRVNQGQGKPARIYIVTDTEQMSESEEKTENGEPDRTETENSTDTGDGSALTENHSLKFCQSVGNKNNKNKTDISYTNLSINLSKSAVIKREKMDGFTDTS